MYCYHCSRHGFLYIRGWMQIVIAPNDLFSWNNRYNKYNVTKDIYTLSSWSYARELTLCMLAFWSHEGVVFFDFLPSPHPVTSFHLPCLGSTDAHCPRLGDPVPLPPKWRPFSQGLRTLPYRDPEQALCEYVRAWLKSTIFSHASYTYYYFYNKIDEKELCSSVKISFKNVFYFHSYSSV